MRKLISLAFLLCNFLLLSAQLKLPAVLSDNMVIQQGKPVNIWGWAKANKKVTVSFLQQNYFATSNAKGKWNLSIPNLKGTNNASDMIISSDNEKIIIHNILIGEVWVCSGQSNMEFPLNGFSSIYSGEIKNSTNDKIRFTTTKKVFDNQENDTVSLSNQWESVNPNTVGDCSAVAYFFAKKLNERLKVPIGLVVDAWGGTPAQAWMDSDAIIPFKNYADEYYKSIKKIDISKLEQIKQENENLFRKKVEEESQRFITYRAVNYNDADWENATLPGNWEATGHPNFDGIAAYRIEFNVSDLDAGKEAELHLPAIDDIDSTYINGHFIGSKKVWNELRTYQVPSGVLVAGKNVLTIWVEDDGGGGGLNNDPDNFYLKSANKNITLSGHAKLKILLPLMPNSQGPNLANLQNSPCVLFNAMISPILNLSMRGVIWYQGESNADQPIEYRSLFPALINNWRQRFKQGNFPFLFVQLASYNPMPTEPEISNWALLREAQTHALKLPNTAMTVTTDIGDQFDIHPKRKKEVGERLAANAFKITYGGKDEIASGPQFKSVLFANNKAIISFINYGSGLSFSGKEINGFSIAGADKKFYVTTAEISGNNIIVKTDSVKKPLYVRYAWANSPLNANLFNKEGFPAEPFRTDK